MRGLSRLQLTFLETVARGEKTVAAVLSDLGLNYRHLKRWLASPRFERELAEVNRWLEFQCETDARIAAVSAMRHTRELASANRPLKAHERAQVRDAVQHARQSDRALQRRPRGTSPGRAARPLTPIHPRFAGEAKAILARMELLRSKAAEK